MTKNPQSKDDSLEALDFIVNVLKEHERNLDKLINELATVTEQLGDTGEISNKVEKVEEKISNLQKEVTNLVTYVTSGSANALKQAVPQAVKEQPSHIPSQAPSQPAPAPSVQGRPSVILRCKQWEDFQALAFHAQTLSFSYKEDEKVFQADAVKGNQIITYVGALPKFSAIFKAALSKQLDVPETSIWEGILAVS